MAGQENERKVVRRAGALGVLAPALAALAMAAPAAAAPVPVAEALAPGAGSATWSAQRMLRAAPVADEPAGSAAAATPAADPLAALARTPLRSKRIPDTTSYPARTHGRTFFRSGGRDFSCSGTVVSTGRGNVFVTAAHCVFDRETGRFVDDLVFVPGYRKGTSPLGTWEATHAVVPGGWPVSGAASLDTGMVQLAPDSKGRQIQEVVGSRGIGFKQPPSGRLLVYGYPAAPARYDGEDLVRCSGRAGGDPIHRDSIGQRCDMQGGASGGGWIAQKSLLVADTSHGHFGSDDFIFGPHFRGPAKALYRFNDRDTYPSVKPVRCGGKPATIVGSDASEKLKGTKDKDVIAGLGGDDKIRSKGGKDRVCAGPGDDVVLSGGGRDRIDAGRGSDRCDGGAGRDRARGCERHKRIP